MSLRLPLDLSLRVKRSNLQDAVAVNGGDCFVTEFILSVAEGFLAMTPSECLRVACGLLQTAGLSLPIHRQMDQLNEAAQAEASPVRAGDSGEGQDEEDDKDEHPTAAASAGATAPEAKTLLQPIEGSSQQKEFQKSFQTALTVSHFSPFASRAFSIIKIAVP